MTTTRRFGEGILPTMPHAGRRPYSEADARWAAENLSAKPPAPAKAAGPRVAFLSYDDVKGWVTIFGC